MRSLVVKTWTIKIKMWLPPGLFENQVNNGKQGIYVGRQMVSATQRILRKSLKEHDGRDK